MKKEVGLGHQKWIYVGLIVVGILLLAFVDFIVLEKIYHPLSAEFDIPWSAYSPIILFGVEVPMLWWHVAFFPLAFLLFILLGVAAKSWRLAVSGITLFVLGWEDIFYYLIQGQWLPSELSWLNETVMGLSRFLTGTADVSSLGVVISAILGVFIAGCVLFSYNPLRFFRRK